MKKMFFPHENHPSSNAADTRKIVVEEQHAESTNKEQDLKSSLIALLNDEEVRKAMPGFYPPTLPSNVQSPSTYFQQLPETVPYNLLNPLQYQHQLAALQSEQAALCSLFLDSGLRNNATLGNCTRQSFVYCSIRDRRRAENFW